ncbi:MAG: DUF975 family protein [Enterococcus sp.]
MKNSRQLKTEAKAMLKGRWKEAILLNLLPTLIAIVIALIIAIPTVLLLMNHSSDLNTLNEQTMNSSGGSIGGFGGGILSYLFVSGIMWTYLDLYRGQKETIQPFKDIFRGFKSPFILGLIALYLLISIFTTLWFLLLIIPGIIKSYAYSQAMFVYYDLWQENQKTPKLLETITISRKLMKGYKWKLFWLDLSFIGWHLLGILSLGIGYLWITPYLYATKAAFYDALPSPE